MWYSTDMWKETPNTTCQDSLCYLAERKDKELAERRMRDAAFEKLIGELSTKQESGPEPQESIDLLWRFIQELRLSEDEKRKILWIFQEEIKNTIKDKKIVPKKKTPEKIPEKTKTAPSSSIKNLLEKIKWVVDRDILSRFPIAYKNYTSMPQGSRDSIYRLSRMFWLNHTHVLWLIANESHFDEKAKSPVWASGHTQLMPGTEKWLSRFVQKGQTKNAWPEERFFALLRGNSDFMNIYNQWGSPKNLALWIAYLGYLTKRYGEKSLRIYNGGINYPNNHENMDYARRVNEFAEAFENILPDDKIYTAKN